MLLKKSLNKRVVLFILFLSFTFSSQNSAAKSLDKEVFIQGSGPNITGKYEFKNTKKEIVAAFKITGSRTSVIIEPDTNSEAEFINIEIDGDEDPEKSAKESYAEFIKAISGQFNWDASRGAYVRYHTFTSGTRRYIEIMGGNPSFLGVRRNGGDVSGSAHWGNLYKVQGSLSDLANASKNDVSAYTGSWTIEGTSTLIKLSSGVDYDMLVRYGSTVYELAKVDGSVIESYQGTTRDGDDELTIKIISGTELKMDLGDSHLKAIRGSGSMSSTTTKSTSTTNLSSVSGTSNPMNNKLFKAINQDDQDQVTEILELGANVNATNSQGRTPLETAIQKSNDDTSLVQLLIDNQAKVTNFGIDKAINKDQDDLINLLVENGGDKNYVAMKAIEKGNATLFKNMVDNHNVTITSQMFNKALSFKKFALADIMISKGFSPNKALEASIAKDASELVYAALEAGGNGNTALKYAVKKNDVELATLAIDNHSANANSIFKEALIKNNIPMLTLLLDKGAKPNAEIPALAKTGKNKLLELLLSKGGNASLGVKPAANADKLSTLALLIKNKANANPIMPIAIKKNNTAMVKLAIDGGAKADAPNFINAASASGNIEIVTMLIEAGADANNGISSAVNANKPNVVKLLIDSGADGSSGALLAQSTKHKSTQLTGILLEAGANAQDGISASVKNKASQVLQQLMDAGGDANNQNLLTTAVINNDLNCSKILIGLGLEVNKSDSSGVTYLHHAAKNDNSGLTKLLLEKGAEVDALAQGNTPLHLAVRNRRGVATVDMLIKAGADVNANNGKGKKVLKIAKGTKIKKLLKAQGAVKK